MDAAAIEGPSTAGLSQANDNSKESKDNILEERRICPSLTKSVQTFLKDNFACQIVGENQRYGKQGWEAPHRAIIIPLGVRFRNIGGTLCFATARKTTLHLFYGF